MKREEKKRKECIGRGLTVAEDRGRKTSGLREKQKRRREQEHRSKRSRRGGCRKSCGIWVGGVVEIRRRSRGRRKSSSRRKQSVKTEKHWNWCLRRKNS